MKELERNSKSLGSCWRSDSPRVSMLLPFSKGELKRDLRHLPRPKRITLKKGLPSFESFARFWLKWGAAGP
jgi:hypothetical protein